MTTHLYVKQDSGVNVDISTGILVLQHRIIASLYSL